jgi:hypothetical protein
MEDGKLLELFNDEKIVEIFESKNHLELAKFLGRKYCGFTIDDEKYVDIFWDSTFNRSWLYLSKEMIVDWMGYKNSKDTMRDFYKKKLLENFEEDVDYKEVTKNNELVKKVLFVKFNE